MNALQMREQIIYAYVGRSKNTPWEKKVNKMTDSQIQALYLNLKNRGKIK